MVVRSGPEITELKIRDEEGQSELEVLVPESLAKIHETRIFSRDGKWKIRSEGGAGDSVLVNGMRLPSKIDLDLLPDTVLQIGDVKLKIHRP